MIKTQWLNPPGEGYTIAGKMAVRFPEVHTVTVSADSTITAGQFKLAFTSVVSAATVSYPTVDVHANGVNELNDEISALEWDSTAEQVRVALQALDSICGDAGSVNSDCYNTQARQVEVTRTGDGTKTSNYGYTFSISFVGAFVSGALHRLKTSRIRLPPPVPAPFTVTGGLNAAVVTDVVNIGKALGTDTEIQTIIVAADKPVTVGGYKIEFTHRGSTATTGCFVWNAAASEVEAGIEALANVDSVRVEREGDAGEKSCSENCKYGYKYTVFFDGNAVRGNVGNLASHIGMTTANSAAAGPNDCVKFQAIENNVPVDATGVVTQALQDNGGFAHTNTVFGTSTAAADLKSDLEQLPAVEVVEISRSVVDRQGGYAWHIVFPVSAADAGVDSVVCGFEPTAGYDAPTDITCSGMTVTDGNMLGSTFILSGSEPIAYDAAANDVKSALEATKNIGTVSVSRSVADSQRGYTWSITFITDIGDIAMLKASSSLTGTESNIVVRCSYIRDPCLVLLYTRRRRC